MMTTQNQVRGAFFRDTGYKRQAKKIGPNRYRQATQNEYPADVRMAFVDYVDMLHRDGEISDALAERVTL